MNIRSYSIALLISALPMIAFSQNEPNISLNHADFVAAESINHDGEVTVKVKLSKSGKAKFKKLNKEAIGKKIHAEVGGVPSDLTLRAPITGEALDLGPFSPAEADKIVGDINRTGSDIK